MSDPRDRHCALCRGQGVAEFVPIGAERGGTPIVIWGRAVPIATKPDAPMTVGLKVVEHGDEGEFYVCPACTADDVTPYEGRTVIRRMT